MRKLKKVEIYEMLLDFSFSQLTNDDIVKILKLYDIDIDEDIINYIITELENPTLAELLKQK